MSDSTTMALDLSNYRFGTALEQLVAKGQEVVMPRTFPPKAAVILANAFHGALDQMEDLTENSGKEIRGKEIAGWALHDVYRPKYKSSAKVGTRYYERKRRIGDRRGTSAEDAFVRKGLDRVVNDSMSDAHVAGLEKALRAKFHRHELDRLRGTIGVHGKARRAYESQPVADRPYERVWRRRASGKLYEESSEMLRDTGAFQNSLIGIQTRLDGTIVEFRPGGNVDYFDAQNTRRPVFIFYEPDDGPPIVDALEASIRPELAQFFEMGGS